MISHTTRRAGALSGQTRTGSGARSPEKASSLGNASFARRGSKLDESLVAAKRSQQAQP